MLDSIFFLVMFVFALWTLAFKIEWLKTGQLIKKIPDYLNDLFYKNVPTDAEDYDLSLGKQSTSNTATKAPHAKSNAQHLDEFEEHHAVRNQDDDQSVLHQQFQDEMQHDVAEHQLEQKIATQPNPH